MMNLHLVANILTQQITMCSHVLGSGFIVIIDNAQYYIDKMGIGCQL